MDDLFERMMQNDRDRAIDGFYKHFIAFAVVIALLAIVNVATSDKFWLHWVVLGWGIGLGFHAYCVFVRRPQREARLRASREARRGGPEAAPSPGPTSERSDEGG